MTEILSRVLIDDAVAESDEEDEEEEVRVEDQFSLSVWMNCNDENKNTFHKVSSNTKAELEDMGDTRLPFTTEAKHREKVYDNTLRVLTSLMDPFSRGAFRGHVYTIPIFWDSAAHTAEGVLEIGSSSNIELTKRVTKRRRLTEEKSNLLSYYSDIWVSLT
nr:hypothetical protein [Tanacetum cinerariifolium]